MEFFWNTNRFVAWILVLSGTALALWAGIRPQSPGVSIGLLGGAAGIMSVRPRMHPAEKFSWVVLLVTFTVLEVIAIGRGERAAEATRAAQNAAFGAIADSLKLSISQSREQYGSTIEHVDGVLTETDNVLGTTKKAADLAREGVDDLTGGDTYVVVRPVFVPLADSSNTFALAVADGANCKARALQDLSIVIRKLPIPDGGTIADLQKVLTSSIDGQTFKGTLPAHVAQPLGKITPALEGESSYLISVFYLNKQTSETLKVRRGETGTWEYSYVVVEDMLDGDAKRPSTMKQLEKTDPTWRVTVPPDAKQP